jgi:hypothetical protein
MALTVTHSTVVAVADDGTSPVGSDEWNDDHAITGTVGPDEGARELLTANRTYYVRTDGNDANTGLVNNSGGAWLTPQYAMDWIGTNIDQGSYTVFVQFADGTYDGPAVSSKPMGKGYVELLGNSGDNTAVVFTDDLTFFTCLDLAIPGLNLQVRDLTLSPVNGTEGFTFDGSSCQLYLDNVRFEAPVGGADFCCNFWVTNCYLYADACQIDGDWSGAANVGLAGNTCQFNGAWTISGTPSWSSAFMFVSGPSMYFNYSVSFSGSATGKRYEVSLNGVISTGGGGANFFPGDSAGSTATGGQYS